MSLSGLTLKPLETIVTTDGYSSVLLTFDLSLASILTAYGYGAVSNYNKCKIDIMGGRIDDGYVDSISFSFEFITYYDSGSGLADFTDQYPLKKKYTSYFGEGLDSFIEISISGSDLLIEVTGITDQTWSWILNGTQLITFADLEP